MLKSFLSYSFIIIVFSIHLSSYAGENDFLRPIGRPPKAAPQMRQGGEALPPLPLPVTPLRRSEKKRPPSPATMIGKVIWGSHLDYTWENGKVSRVYDWNMVPADCQQLLKVAQRHLKLEYKVETTSLKNFSATPAEIPVLYFSGGRSLNFTDEDREVLRKYLFNGGMIWFDSVVGSPYFYKSALSELEKILPSHPVKRLPLEHPIFHMVDDALKTNLKKRANIPPVLDGVYIGSRVAAVVSPYGLGVGWDNITPSLIPKADYYDRKSSLLLGLNLSAYALGYFRVGQSHAKADVYRSKDLKNSADPLVFAQIKTNGVWNTEPGAASNLLRFMDKNLQVTASYLKKSVTPGKDDLSKYAFLYLSGITDFKFSDVARKALRKYVIDGGYILIDNSLGMKEFNDHVRAELRKIFPENKLQKIAIDSNIFLQGPYKVQAVKYTIATQAKHPKLKTPWLEGIKIDGDYHVIYSPFDIAAGWQGDDHPLSYGYSSGDALQLGANIFVYFMTH